jgi:hypothetical protein
LVSGSTTHLSIQHSVNIFAINARPMADTTTMMATPEEIIFVIKEDKINKG